MFFKGTRASFIKSETVSNYIFQRFGIVILNENVIEDKSEYQIYSAVTKDVERFCRTLSNSDVIKLGKRLLLVMFAVKSAKDAVSQPDVSLEAQQALIQFASDAFIINVSGANWTTEQNTYIQKTRNEIDDLSSKCNFISKPYTIS